ncbi:MAG: hypothetical protein OHK0015_40600 [Chloroflexi bacterium OHK40]
MNTRRVESFLLRLVVDDEPGADADRWRGRIQHIGSGSEQQIDELAQAIAFISGHLSAICDVRVDVESLSDEATA